mmetsp:Transcript_13949/g.59699  ORF Transcript_13949/g.59699 Transcript_13949/m.59699 type:complete len:276 (+) Transcript_13949:886-1713(+)
MGGAAVLIVAGPGPTRSPPPAPVPSSSSPPSVPGGAANAPSASSAAFSVCLASSTLALRSPSAISAACAAAAPSPIFPATLARLWHTDASAATSPASRADCNACANQCCERSNWGGSRFEASVPSATNAPIAAPGGRGGSSSSPTRTTPKHASRHFSAGSHARMRIIPWPAIRSASHSISRPSLCRSKSSCASMAMSCSAETACPVAPRQKAAVAAPRRARMLWNFRAPSAAAAAAAASSSAAGNFCRSGVCKGVSLLGVLLLKSHAAPWPTNAS